MSVKVFVSGCYDILHGGHIEFFTAAKALGDHLTVCLPSDEVLFLYKKRKPSLPLDHKVRLLSALEVVDEVVIGGETELEGINFKQHLLEIKPEFLVATVDDRYQEQKKALCTELGMRYVALPKTCIHMDAISTTGLVNFIRAPLSCPVRVDFAGGWLDCSENTDPQGRIVNCTISPLVSLSSWPYRQKAGLGGSGAFALLTGEPGIETESKFGNGWQDVAVIKETGLCVWEALETPKLEYKTSGGWLKGKMALLWTGCGHSTKAIRTLPRDYEGIVFASQKAAQAVWRTSLALLQASVRMSYQVQLKEGMEPLPDVADASYKYCGSGWGGYALYLFAVTKQRDKFVSDFEEAMKIEPYIDDKY